MKDNCMVYITFLLEGEDEEANMKNYNKIIDFIEDTIGHTIHRERHNDPEEFERRVKALQGD